MSSYGAAPGYQTAALTPGSLVADTLVWRSRSVDPSGLYYLGARYYDPLAGRFISPDPLGHAASMDLYSFCDGNPVNAFDPDGRLVAGFANGAGQWGSQTWASMGNGLDGLRHYFGAEISPGRYQADPIYQKRFDSGSAAFQLGHQVGYASAEIGFQAGVLLATEGLGNLARAAAMGRAARMGTAVSAFEARSVLASGWQAAQPYNRASASVGSWSMAARSTTASTGAGQSVVRTFNAGGNGYKVGEALPDGRMAGVGPGAAHPSDFAAKTTPSSLWSKAEFNGTRVYQRNDLINPALVDARGRSNLQRMQQGLAPVGPDGKSINLHHTIQTADSPLAEMTATFHQQNSRVIHINPNTIPSGIDRPAFDAFRRDYWINRANDFSP